MEKFISVIIPNRNGSATIGKCLEAALASDYGNFEVIVVDDCSSDDSVAIIKEFPCRLIELKEHAGAGKARNKGAASARGEILFFTDADCLLSGNALACANKASIEAGPRKVIGGTYTLLPYDKDFFSTFQSVFIHYSEVKNSACPDYIATHAMIIHAGTFRDSGGFREDFMPILEDVEFSHRLHRMGCALSMDKGITVRHMFGFSLKKSILNAYRKSSYWTTYSLQNRDLLADSGTASRELKFNGITFLCCLLLCLPASHLTQNASWLLLAAALCGLNIFSSRSLFAEFYKTGGVLFAFKAVLYYILLYPAPVLAGAFSGAVSFARQRK